MWGTIPERMDTSMPFGKALSQILCGFPGGGNTYYPRLVSFPRQRKPAVPELVETVVIGGGQAGLAISHHLAQRGREHVIFERGRVAERWRSERWDSLYFQFPNWMMRLPGHIYAGDDPDGFSQRDDVVRFITDYGARIRGADAVWRQRHRFAPERRWALAHAGRTDIHSRSKRRRCNRTISGADAAAMRSPVACRNLSGDGKPLYAPVRASTRRRAGRRLRRVRLSDRRRPAA